MTQDPKTLALYGVAALTVCASLLALIFAYGEIISIRHPATQGATITVTGEGKASAIPDIATLTFTVREVAKTVPLAQKAVETKVALAKTALGGMSIADKDITTLSYTVNPHYDNQVQGYCNGYTCPPTTSVITGYEVAETIQVKVRKIDDAGAVLAKIGDVNITEVSGPDFTVDDMDAITASAKALAVKDAKAKADVIAKSLGVSLGDIVGYNENTKGYYPPMAFSAKAEGMGAVTSLDTVSLPQGETITKEDVSITYEIR